MPVESATYITDLVPADPNHTDAVGAADSHLRLIKSVLQATLPAANAPITATPAGLNSAGTRNGTVGVVEIEPNGTTAGAMVRLDPVVTSGRVLLANTGAAAGAGALTVTTYDTTDSTPTVAATITAAGISAASLMQAGAALVPSGVVVMWWGLLTAIPAGWTLCDGTNGAPDLRDRFVVGAGLTFGEGAVGGASSATPTTSSDGLHYHTGVVGVAGPFGMLASMDVQGTHFHGGATAGYSLTTADLPSASWTYTVVGSGGDGGNAPGSTLFGSQGGGDGHVHGLYYDGAHAHNVSVSNSPAHQHTIAPDGVHNHTVTVPTVPPFAALAYIMKL